MPDSLTRSFANPPAALLERRFDLPDEDATLAFGGRFAKAILAARLARSNTSNTSNERFPGLQVQLIGDLGAGKTTLVRATLRALGHAGRVRSPTYTLVEPYSLATETGPLELYHFDLYRFADPAEWADAGFREYFDAGAICLVEWPQRAGGLLGVPDLEFTLEQEGEGRVLIARAFSETGKSCLESC
ncbi:tRNA (adenosine(37)-N6)-threonylcarbamoyltransferase complex ATPase subunit type 1 TsaE [Caballeronia sp. dw_19]|uniref:tRNA (adenosine(37)-N6)-threonylcarbamoyltransferase complex ATPase subunit type 1 TsaE n=1 Tax=Caballeronia sp. dw_19 TaxID=2719791 RepID=UPI001BD5113A|nr:tRNA (adenosine(37)-N6)-threonylcarbamoyltransferase complex ATPase subunit type 1 TsaE [Caballeronia sp. dw_19]